MLSLYTQNCTRKNIEHCTTNMHCLIVLIQLKDLLRVFSDYDETNFSCDVPDLIQSNYLCRKKTKEKTSWRRSTVGEKHRLAEAVWFWKCEDNSA